MCLVEHAEIARAVIREAYRAGAQHVVVLYSDLHLRRAAIELGPESEIGWSAPYLLDWIKRWPEENPALISLAGNPDPDLLSDLDPSLVGRADPKDIRVAMLENITGRHVNWTIVAAPNAGWATQVFGEPDVERLWEAVARATRIDEPDPVAAWRTHAETLQARADALNAAGSTRSGFAALEQTSPWASSRARAGSARRSRRPRASRMSRTCRRRRSSRAPDWRRAEGIVRSTRPLVAGGTKVSGLEVRLEGGQDRRCDSRRRSRDRSCATRGRRAGSVPRRGRSGRRLVAGQADRSRVLRHALRRERHLPHRVRRRHRGRAPGDAPAGRAARARRERLGHPHRLHGRRGRRRRGRARRRRKCRCRSCARTSGSSTSASSHTPLLALVRRLQRGGAAMSKVTLTDLIDDVIVMSSCSSTVTSTQSSRSSRPRPHSATRRPQRPLAA